MITGIKVESGIDLVAESYGRKLFVVGRTYVPQLRSIVSSDDFVVEGNIGTKLQIGFPWVSTFDERIVGINPRSWSHYNDYDPTGLPWGDVLSIPAQVGVLQPDGSIEYYYPEMDVPVEYDAPMDGHLIPAMAGGLGSNRPFAGNCAPPASTLPEVFELEFHSSKAFSLRDEVLPTTKKSFPLYVEAGWFQREFPAGQPGSTPYYRLDDINTLIPVSSMGEALAQYALEYTAETFETSANPNPHWYLPMTSPGRADSLEELRLQGFAYTFVSATSYLANNQTCSELPANTDREVLRVVLKLSYVGGAESNRALVPHDKNLVGDGYRKVYDNSSGLLSRTYTDEGFVVERFPGVSESDGYVVAERVKSLGTSDLEWPQTFTETADPENRRLLVKTSESQQGVREITWALAFGASHRQDQVTWTINVNQLTRSPNEVLEEEWEENPSGRPDPDGLDFLSTLGQETYGRRLYRVHAHGQGTFVQYEYGSYDESNINSDSPESIGDEPTIIDRENNEMPVTMNLGGIDQFPLAGICDGVSGEHEVVVPRVRYRNFAAFFEKIDPQEGWTYNNDFHPGVVRETWIPSYDEQSSIPTWTLAGSFQFCTDERTFDPTVALNTSNEAASTGTMINYAWLHGVSAAPGPNAPAIEYHRNIHNNSIEKVVYPDFQKVTFDPLGRYNRGGYNVVMHDAGVLSTDGVLYFDCGGEAPGRVMKSNRGSVTEVELSKFDGFAESNLAFLRDHPRMSELGFSDLVVSDTCTIEAEEMAHVLALERFYVTNGRRKQVAEESDLFSNKSSYVYDDPHGYPTEVTWSPSNDSGGQLDPVVTSEYQYADSGISNKFRVLSSMETTIVDTINGNRIDWVDIEYLNSAFPYLPTKITLPPPIDENEFLPPPGEDENPLETIIAYDSFGRVESITAPDGEVVSFTYLPFNGVANPFSRTVKTIVRGEGSHLRTTTITYEDEGTLHLRWLSPRVVTTTSSVAGDSGGVNNQVSTRTYDGFGRVASITDQSGRELVYHRLPTGRIAKVEDRSAGLDPEEEEGRTLSFDYDLLGRVIATTDQRGNAWRSWFDPFGRLLATASPEATMDGQSPGNLTTVLRYDRAVRKNNNHADNQVGLGSDWDLRLYNGDCGCDGSGRVYRIEQYSGPVSEAEVDAGCIDTMLGSAVRAVDLYYDASGRVGYIEVLKPQDGNCQQFSYEVVRTIAKKFDRKGLLQEITDDGLLLLPSNEPFGDQTERYEYNSRFELVSVTAPDGFKTHFNYDDRGNLIAVTNPLGIIEGHSKDFLGRSNRIVSALVGDNTITYHDGSSNSSGMVEGVSFGNGGGISFVYDEIERLKKLTNTIATSGVPEPFLQTLHDTYDPMTWNREDEEVTAGWNNGEESLFLAYTYTPYSELATSSLDGSSGTSVSGGNTSYTLDAASNIKSANSSPGNWLKHAYDGFNQLTEIERFLQGDPQLLGNWDSYAQFTYDSLGNLTYWNNTAASGSNGDRAYFYDDLNHLAAVGSNSGGQLENWKWVFYLVDSGASLVHRVTTDSNFNPISVRRLFYNGLSPMLTLLGDAPAHSIVEQFVVEPTLADWTEFDLDGGGAAWSLDMEGNLFCDTDSENGSSGAMLWDARFYGGETEFTLTAQMNLGEGLIAGEDPDAITTGSGGVVISWQSPSDYLRIYGMWVEPIVLGHPYELRLRAEGVYPVGGQPVAVLFDTDAGYIDRYTLPTDLTLKVVAQRYPDSGLKNVEVYIWSTDTSEWVDTGLEFDLGSQDLDQLFSNTSKLGIFGGNGEVYFDQVELGRTEPWSNPIPQVLTPGDSQFQILGDGSAFQINESGAIVPNMVSFDADSQWTEAAGLTWVGPSGEGSIPFDPARPVIGLLIRRDAPEADALSGISVKIETSVYDVELHYDTTATEPSAGAKTAVIPFGGDLAESMNDHWQLIAIDPVGDVQMLFEDERAVSGQPSIGRIQGVTILGRHFSVAHIYLWERLPEKIYTASLGEWSLARRYENDEAGLTSQALPHYEQRHHHLHRNGRLDVVGYSPHDTLAQSSRMQQFGPYGELVAEGYVTPQGEALIDASNLAIQSGPERQRVLALGLTSKQFDPETKLYYFGYRWYSPELMRWTQKEPLGLDGPNLWHFTHGNPIGRIDWNGLDDDHVVKGRQYHHLLTQNNKAYFWDTFGIDVHKKEWGVLLPTDLHQSMRVSWESAITDMINKLKASGSTNPADVQRMLDELINDDAWRLKYGGMMLPGEDYLTWKNLRPDQKELRCLPGMWTKSDDGLLHAGPLRAMKILVVLGVVGTLTDAYDIAALVHAGEYDAAARHAAYNNLPVRLVKGAGDLVIWLQPWELSSTFQSVAGQINQAASFYQANKAQQDAIMSQSN